MPVPFLKALALTLGAALSNSTFDLPCASFPVTTRRIGLIPSAIVASSVSGFLVRMEIPAARGPGMRRDRVHVGYHIHNHRSVHGDRLLQRPGELARLLYPDTNAAKGIRHLGEIHVEHAAHLFVATTRLAVIG